MMMKLCKDCKYCEPDPMLKEVLKSQQYAGCAHPKNAENLCPVSGEIVVRRYNFASTQRTGNRLDAWILNKCGRAARWFEAK